MNPRHLFLRASAGTGKTTRVVREYCEAVLGRPGQEPLSPLDIVAITFTRKAAADLRHRIRLALSGKAPPKLLDDLGRALIGNFHTVSLQLLRSLGSRGGLPEGVDILGENKADELLFLEATKTAWLGRRSSVRDAAARVAEHIRLGDLAQGLWGALSKAREDDRPIDADALLAPSQEARAGSRVACEEQVDKLLEDLARFADTVDEPERSVLATFTGHTWPDRQRDWRAWAGIVALRLANLPKSADRVRYEYRKRFMQEIDPLHKEVLPGLIDDDLYTTLRPDLVHLVDAAWAQYEREKARRGAVDFTDLVADAVAVLDTDRSAHASLRERVRLVFVDEAQDTNRLQRRFVHLLAGLEGPARDDHPVAELVVVGDHKQAIYTFRGADPRAFAELAQDVEKLGGHGETLSRSYRSTPAVIDSLNLLGPILFPTDYEALEAHAGSPTGPRPAVAYLPTAAHDEAEVLAAWIRGQVDAGERAGDHAILLRYMSRADRFAAALAARGLAYTFAGGEGLYKQDEVRDLVALLRWLADPQDVLSAATVLRSPIVGASDDALTLLLTEPRGLAALRDGADIGAAAAEPAISRWAELFPKLVGAATELAPDRLVLLVDRLMDLRAVYGGLDGGEQRIANLSRIFELARAASERGIGAARFAREQQDRIDADHGERLHPIATAQNHAVLISTIHQAKGLEFPTVILADLAKGGSRGDSDPIYTRETGIALTPAGNRGAAAFRRAKELLDADELAEGLRLAYVAVSRAKSRVIIVGVRPNKSNATPRRQILDWMKALESRGAMATVAPPVEATAPGTMPATSAESRAAAAALVARARSAPVPLGTLHLPVTTLTTYADCLRRGALSHNLGLRERMGTLWVAGTDPADDPPLGPAERGRLVHAVLAALPRRPSFTNDAEFVDAQLLALGHDPKDIRTAESRADALAFLGSAEAQELRAADALYPELAVQLPAVSLAGGRQRAILHGQIDLVAERGGRPLLVDYKHSARNAAAHPSYVLQLHAYALAAASLWGLADSDVELEAWLVFLRGAPTVERFRVSRADRQALHGRLEELVGDIARLADPGAAWPGVAADRCAALGCGFVSLCHDATAAGPTGSKPPHVVAPQGGKTTPGKPGQLSLF